MVFLVAYSITYCYDRNKNVIHTYFKVLFKVYRNEITVQTSI